MRPFAFLLVAPLVIASAALAETCPAAPDHSDSLNELIAQIQKAQTEQEARLISNRMWEFWADAPDDQSQAILDRGMRRREAWDLLGALNDFDKLVEYCPEYAEGYNQRAFVNFLRQDFQAALVDLDRALELSPRHIAAMSGRALSLMALKRTDEAREALAEALELNPWLPERGLAAPGGPLEVTGQDI
ncbi:tetratricopeptide repeat protein [Ruegeria sediminis]|uniref:Tetratricopeptide repeat protein n=1 Tax=Ruegeria sediminis TaxID=2583820 RepID=A0ABY2WY20_9RHOB|nr:tetratricopeptide repeat protein [Ruegeria sediminis]TMV07767.1 tetratricopeptide repeat protein [Ruegeria sediminis]